MILWLFACNDISGLWREYSFNKLELPIEECVEDLCSGIEGFTMEVSKEHTGDFRLEVQRDNEFFIYTFAIQTILSNPDDSTAEWGLQVDNTENPDFPSEWDCEVRGFIVDCTIGDNVYQLRRNHYP